MPSALTRNDCGRALPALADVAQRGEVVHDLGLRVGEPCVDRGRVGDVERVRSVAVERQHVVAARLEVRDEVRTDEATRAGDRDLHAAHPACESVRDEVLVDGRAPR